MANKTQITLMYLRNKLKVQYENKQWDINFSFDIQVWIICMVFIQQISPIQTIVNSYIISMGCIQYQSDQIHKFKSQLKEILLADQSYLFNLLHQQVFQTIYRYFESFYHGPRERHQILNYLIEYAQYARQSGNHTEKERKAFCQKIASSIQKLEGGIYFTHLFTIKLLKYISVKMGSKEKKSYYDHFFQNLSFSLEEEQIFKCCGISRYLCNQNLDSFSFITLYLVVSLRKQSHLGLDILEDKLITGLKKMQKEYPASEVEQVQPTIINQINSFVKTVHTKKKQPESIPLVLGSKQNSERVKNFIISKAAHAEEDYNNFIKITKYVCSERGFNFKSNLKINHKNLESAVWRVTQKLSQKYFKKEDKYSVKKYFDVCQESQKNDVLQFVKREQKEVESKIEKIFQSIESLDYYVTDLVRGKCIYSNAQDILYTAQCLVRSIIEHGCTVVEIKNRLNKHTRDFVILFSLSNSIAELQLVLKLDVIANQFNHKIYQILRSTTFSPISNLYIHNQKWLLSLFQEVYNIVLYSYNERVNQEGFQQDSSFLKNSFEDMEIFIEEFGIKCTQKDDWAESECFEKIQILRDLTKTEDRDSLDKKEGKESQIYLNTAKFFKMVHLYDKSLKFYDLYHSLNVVEEKIEDNVQILKEQGVIWLKKGNVKKAKEFFESCQRMIEQKGDKMSKLYHDILENFGVCLVREGKFKDALKYFEESLNFQEKNNHTASQQYAKTLEHIGLCFRKFGDYKRSIGYYEKSLLLIEKISSKESEDYSSALNSMGQAYKLLGEYEKSLDFLLRSLAIIEKVKGKNSEQSSNIYRLLGQTYNAYGKYDKALQYYKKDVQIVERLRGKQSLFYSSLLQNIGLAYKNKKQFQTALQYYKKSIVIKEKVSGEDSFSFSLVLNTMAEIYRSVGQHQQAHQLYKKCLEIREKTNGIDSLQYANIINNMGENYRKWKKYKEAVEYFERSLIIKQKATGKESLNCSNTWYNLGKVYRDTNQYEKALQIYQKCLDIRQKLGGKDSIDCSYVLYRFTEIYWKMGDLARAEELCLKSLSIQRKISGKDSWQLAQTLYNTALLEKDMKKIQSARAYAEEGYKINLKQYGEEDGQTIKFRKLLDMLIGSQKNDALSTQTQI